MINIKAEGGDNIDFKDYIKLIQEQCQSNGSLGNKHVYEHDNKYIEFWKDDGECLDGLQWRYKNDILWTWSNPEEYYNQFCKDKLKFEVYSHRFYDEPKLLKPKELKGIKQAFSVDYIPNKCRCQCFIKDNDVWVKHRDYFSEVQKPEPHELGMPLNYFAEKYMGKNRPKKFIYDDAWGSVVLRDEAWLILYNLISEIQSGRFELDIINDIREQQEQYHGFEKYELVSTDMERFWEGVVKESKKHLVISVP